MALHRLLYASTARPGLAAEDIEDIVATARRVNNELGVTGTLAFDGSGFAQILEGDGETIKRLYERIERDRRHTGCVILSLTPAAKSPVRKLVDGLSATERPDHDPGSRGLSGRLAPDRTQPALIASASSATSGHG